MLTAGNLDARKFGSGSTQHSSAGRPRTSEGKQRVTVSLRTELIRDYDAEAERRWPGSERRRGELMEEALVSWMLARKTNALQCRHLPGCECYLYLGEGEFERVALIRSAPPSPASKPQGNE